MNKAYNKRIRPWTLRVGNLVLKTAGHIQKGLSASKFAPKCEWPFTIWEAYNSGYLLIFGPDSKISWPLLLLNGWSCTILNIKVDFFVRQASIVNLKQMNTCAIYIHLLEAYQVSEVMSLAIFLKVLLFKVWYPVLRRDSRSKSYRKKSQVHIIWGSHISLILIILQKELEALLQERREIQIFTIWAKTSKQDIQGTWALENFYCLVDNRKGPTFFFNNISSTCFDWFLDV